MWVITPVSLMTKVVLKIPSNFTCVFYFEVHLPMLEKKFFVVVVVLQHTTIKKEKKEMTN
jgi:hypothetical protein